MRLLAGSQGFEHLPRNLLRRREANLDRPVAKQHAPARSAMSGSCSAAEARLRADGSVRRERLEHLVVSDRAQPRALQDYSSARIACGLDRNHEDRLQRRIDEKCFSINLEVVFRA